MAIHCERCGVRVASRTALEGHVRRAHSRSRNVQPSLALVPAKPRPGPIRAEVVDAAEIVRPRREVVPARLIHGDVQIAPRPKLQAVAGGDGPPRWWEPQADPEWRAGQWNRFPPECRRQILAQRAGAVFVRVTDAEDKTVLWSQYHALKALAVRLDAGIATERERAAFEAGLAEYNRNFDAIRARRALPC